MLDAGYSMLDALDTGYSIFWESVSDNPLIISPCNWQAPPSAKEYRGQTTALDVKFLRVDFLPVVRIRSSVFRIRREEPRASHIFLPQLFTNYYFLNTAKKAFFAAERAP